MATQCTNVRKIAQLFLVGLPQTLKSFALWKGRIAKIFRNRGLCRCNWCLTQKSKISLNFSDILNAIFEFQNQKSLCKIPFKAPF